MGRDSARRHLIGSVEVATSFASRLFGLMGRKDLSRARLLIPGCSSIHTFFMRGAIDIVFLDRHSKAVASFEEVRPWRMLWGPSRAESTLELPPGSIREQQIGVGDQIECLPN